MYLSFLEHFVLISSISCPTSQAQDHPGSQGCIRVPRASMLRPPASAGLHLCREISPPASFLDIGYLACSMMLELRLGEGSHVLSLSEGREKDLSSSRQVLARLTNRWRINESPWPRR